MTSRKVFKIILIAGLDCGLQTYHLLKKKDFADIRRALNVDKNL